ncbi:hypothetical protein C2E23DRAFT_738149 [Lenzites betulinus]|nr:hypothetical protein C2E23DRAFT_738149 [Lenzites betulinus]
MEIPALSQRRFDEPPVDSRGISDRPFGRGPPGNDRRDDRAPPRIAGTNNAPISARPSGYASDHSVHNPVRSPVEALRRTDDFGGNPRRPGLGESESFERRRQPPLVLDPPSSTLPRNDRAGRHPSISQDEPPRIRDVETMIDRPLNVLPPRPRDGPRGDGPMKSPELRQSRFGPPSGDFQPRIWQTRDEAQSSRVPDTRPYDDRAPMDAPRPRDGNPWEPRQDHPARRWPDKDVFAPGPGARDAANSRARSPEAPIRGRSNTPPRSDARRYDGPPIEPPVKVHPERARYLAGQADDADRGFKFAPPRRQGRSPDRAYPDRRDDFGRDLPPRPIDDTRLPPPRERSPPPAFNGHRPITKRGGSLLERLTLDDGAPLHESGSSLRDRVDSHDSSEGASAPADAMDLDAEGNGSLDDSGKGGRGGGRRRGGKPKGRRRFAGP